MRTYAQAGKSIKKELEAKFPGVRFSVRSKRFSGGNDVRVSWENGPTTKEVEQVSNKYQEGNFNGMIDLYEYDYNRPKTNGSAKYVFAERSINNEGYKAMMQSYCQLNDIPFVEPYWNIQARSGEYVTTIINRIMSKTPILIGHKIVGLKRTDCQCGSIEEFYRVKTVDYQKAKNDLVSDAARASELFGDDELEYHAKYKNPVLNRILED